MVIYISRLLTEGNVFPIRKNKIEAESCLEWYGSKLIDKNKLKLQVQVVTRDVVYITELLQLPIFSPTNSEFPINTNKV